MGTPEDVAAEKYFTPPDEVDELAEVIEQFMIAVPGNPEEGERDWSSLAMAEAIIKAGYRKVALQ